MMRRTIIRICGIAAAALLAGCEAGMETQLTPREVLGNLDGALVVVDCSTGRTDLCRADVARTPLPPCSTFKIVNALIGFEIGLIHGPDEPFYRWDGVERSVAAWNRDLTVRQAFQASCVPAFQGLARRIGPGRMTDWLGRIDYGDRNISAGIDVFWLPSKSRRTVLISPMQQASLMRRIATGKVPFSDRSLALLKEVMFVLQTGKGRLYGKTGSGTDERGVFVLGWFVGYVESGGRTYAFACVARGDHVMSKEARAVVERFMQGRGLL